MILQLHVIVYTSNSDLSCLSVDEDVSASSVNDLLLSIYCLYLSLFFMI